MSRSTNRPSLPVVIVVELFPDGCGLREEGMVWREGQETKTKMKHGVERRGTWSVGYLISLIWVPAFGTLNRSFISFSVLWFDISALFHLTLSSNRVVWENTSQKLLPWKVSLYTRCTVLYRVGRFHYSAREVRCEWAIREQTVLPLKLTLSFNSARMMGTVCVKAPLHSSAPQASQPRPAQIWHMYTLTAPHSPAMSLGKHFKDMSAAQLLVC